MRRSICTVDFCLSKLDAGNEAERLLEVVPDLLPAERNVPTIVRIVDDESTGGVSRTGRFVVGPQHVQSQRKILVSTKSRRGKSHIGSEERVAPSTGWIAVCDDSADPG